MKKLTTLAFVFYTVLSFGQSMQLQNSINYLRNKEYDKAKTATDLAAENESTKSNAKTWMFRGRIYQDIYMSKDAAVKGLDNEAEEKSLEAFINCLKLDKDNIYKDQVKSDLVVAAVNTGNKAGNYIMNKEYDKAIRCYDLQEAAIPFDFDQALKRNNITKETVMHSKFKTYRAAANKAKMTEYADKLIAAHYKDPGLYTDMIKISLLDKDTTMALSYIEKGKVMFEDNMDLINQEINIYLARNKMNELKDKLNNAIELAPDNEVLHAILANVYQRTNEQDKAEEEYLKALDIKPDFENANYNLGVIYFNKGNEWNEKLNNLPPKETAKAKEYEAKANDEFKKAVGYFEKSYEISPDKATKQRLRQLLLRLGETEKAEKYK